MAPKKVAAPAEVAAPAKAEVAAPMEVEEVEPPPRPSVLLQQSGWEVFTMPTTGNKYYFSEVRREARVQPPYFTVLHLEEASFMNFTKDDIWKAFFVQKQQFKREEEGALTEELEDPEMDVDWALIMEAFSVLTNPEARAEYEQRNLMSHAKLQLTGLMISHESRKREEAQKAAVVAAAAEKIAAEEVAAAAPAGA